MYAIMKACGRQYKIEPGMTLELDRMSAEPGETVVLDDAVLMLNNEGDVTIGDPTVQGAQVELEVNEHFRGKKIIAFKMKRRKRYRRKRGHRQELTRVTVKNITAG